MSQVGRVEKHKRQRPRVAKEDRLRASRACLSCQRSKSRCIEYEAGKGQCARCQRKALICTWAKVDAGLEVASSSRARPLMESHDTTLRPWTSLELGIDDVITSSGITSSPASRGLSTVTIDEDQPHRTPLYATMSGPILEPTGSTSFISSGRILSRIREAMFMKPSTTIHEDVSFGEASDTRAKHASVNQGLMNNVFEQLPPKPVADFLCMSCFELGTDSFFYFDQIDFRRGLDEIYTNSKSSLRQDCTFMCTVLMTLAVGSQFAHLKATISQSNIHETGHEPGLLFYSLARSLMPDVIADQSVAAVQACLVMSVYLLPAHAYDTSYLYMGLALRMAIALNLHQNKSDIDMSAEVVEARHRLWWSIYSLERTVSIKLGRPRSIDVDDISTPLPVPWPSIDNVQVVNNISHQKANAELVKVMDRIAQKVPMTFNPQDSIMMDMLEELQEELQRWKTTLPSVLQLYHVTPHTKGYRTVVHLHLNYLNAWIILCRLPLLFLVRERLKKAFVDPDLELLKETRVERYAGYCIEAARKMIVLFATLQETRSLAKFSFTDFQGCSTATIIILLHSILEAKAPHSTSIASGLDCLRFMASGSEEAKVGVRFVEEFQSLAYEASARTRENSTREETTTQDLTSMMAYEAWLQELPQQVRSESDNVASTSSSHNLLSTEQMARDLPPLPQFPEDESIYATTLTNEEHLHQPVDISGAALEGARSTDAFSEILPSGFAHLDESFILGLTGLDTLDFTDQTYWPS